jgi:hypothetical protein
MRNLEFGMWKNEMSAPRYLPSDKCGSAGKNGLKSGHRRAAGKLERRFRKCEPLFGVHPSGCPFFRSIRRKATAVLDGYDSPSVVSKRTPAPTFVSHILIRFSNLFILALLLSLVLCGCATDNMCRGTSATDLSNRPVNPLRTARSQPTVLLFVRTDCPVSNRYAPEIERLYRAYAPHHITFWLVYPDADTSTSDILKHEREYSLDVPALRDPAHQLVRAAGATATPEAAVFLPGSPSILAYRGRIDDRIADFGKQRPEARERDLENVLEAIAAGKKIAPRTTKAVGCYISER